MFKFINIYCHNKVTRSMKKGAAKPEKEETTIKEDNKDSLKKKAEPTKDTSLKKDTKVDMKVDAKVEPKTIIKEESNVKDKNKSNHSNIQV